MSTKPRILGSEPVRFELARRRFLEQASLFAGGLGLAGLTTHAHGQSCSNPVVPGDCAPPASSTPAQRWVPDPAAPLRTRRNAARLSAAESDRLKAAYKAMRDLSTSNPQDPRGWAQQGNVHCWYCGGGSNGQQGEEIHSSWLFFPWHRCYLFFHERILGKLVGDPTLALAYWNWGNVANRRLPAPFVTPNDPSNPLFDARRGAAPTQSVPSAYVGATALRRALAPNDWRRFLGTPDGPTSAGGSVENGPHGAVHIWVGDASMQCANIDMGVLATAARDPLFFSHHGNIDRLWDVWLDASSTHQNPTSTDWLQHRFTFYDENATLVSISVADVLDHERSLRYVYDDGAGRRASGGTRLALAEPAPEPVRLSAQPLARSVAVPAELGGRITGARAAVVPPPARRYLLHIDGIQVPSHKQAVVRVFANRPGAGPATAVDSANYLGFFAIVAKSAQPGGHAHGKQNVVLDVTDTLPEAQRGKTKLEVTLVPVAGDRAAPREVDLTFEALYLTEE